MEFDPVINWLYKWQELLGAFTGAFAAFFLGWISLRYEAYRRRKERLYYLDKMLTARANSVHHAKLNIISFLDERLKVLIESLKQEDKYDVSIIFFPLMHVQPVDQKVFDIETGSGYVDSKLIQAYILSNGFSESLEDIRAQLSSTLQTNQSLALTKATSPNEQVGHFKNHLISYDKSVRFYLLEKNIPAYIRHLLQTKVALNYLQEKGIIKWRFKFDPKYRFFFSAEQYRLARNKSFEKIEAYFKEQVDREMERL